MEIELRTWSAAEVAKRYGCSKPYVIRLCHDGILDARLVGKRWFITIASAECVFEGKCASRDAA